MTIFSMKIPQIPNPMKAIQIFSIKDLLIIISSLLILIGCEQESVGTRETFTPVIEAYIYAGLPIDSVRITQSISYAQSDSNAFNLDNLSPVISDGTDTYLLQSIGNGYYQNLDLIIQAETSYQLSFEYKDKQIRAVTYIPAEKPAQISMDRIEMERIEAGSFPNPGALEPVDPIDISWDNSEGDFYYVLISNLEDDPSYINEFLRQRLEENGLSGRFMRISEPGIMDFYPINPQRDLQQFGEHRVIVFRVNPEYAALYESSSSSTLNISEPPTNISNGLGIFTGLNSDTLYFDVIEK